MGTDALAQENDSTEEQDLEGSEDQEGTDDSNESEGAEGSEETEGEKSKEIEIVRQSGTGSQPDEQQGIRNRINGLNSKVEQANTDADQLRAQLESERKKNELLELRHEQQKTAQAAPPNAMDFDDGDQDKQYLAALNDYHQSMANATVDKRLADYAASQTQAVDPNIEREQQRHYERANELGAKDFDATEGKAISILGKGHVKDIIRVSENSHLLIYYLGKNPGAAEDLKRAIDANPATALVQIGRLEAELSVKPRARSGAAPNPDEDLPGGSPSTTKRGPAGATYS